MPSQGGSTVTYAIGNSLYKDSRPEDGQALIAADGGRFLFPQYHTHGGRSLGEIFNSPSGADSLQGGRWDLSLPTRSRDCLMVQPYEKAGSTLATDVAAANGFMSSYAASPTINPRLGLYMAWPGTPIGNNYNGRWERASSDVDSADTIMARDYFANLYARLAALYPGQIFTIPVGEVIFSVDAAAKAGQLSGLSTASSIYRDGLHLGRVGHFIATSTVLSVLYRRKTQASPASVAYYEAIADGTSTLTEALAAQLETIVWDTVRADSRTSIT